MPDLAIRTPNWLGDAVMALPALGSISILDPDAVIWCHPRTRELFRVFLPSHKVITGPRLPDRTFQRVLLMTDSFRSALEAALSGVPGRVGRRGQLRSPFLTVRLRSVSGRRRHHSADFIELAEAVGASGPWTVPVPSVSPSGPTHVALFPGSRYGDAKHWNGFGELASRIQVELGHPVVFYGTAAEKDALDHLAGSVPGTTSETGLGLEVLSSRLLKAVLTVGNDSGGNHLASALGVPTLTVFGSTSIRWTSPLGPRSSNVSSSVPPDCSPCYRRTCRMTSGTPPCLSSITVEQVAAACSRLLVRDGSESGDG